MTEALSLDPGLTDSRLLPSRRPGLGLDFPAGHSATLQSQAVPLGRGFLMHKVGPNSAP